MPGSKIIYDGEEVKRPNLLYLIYINVFIFSLLGLLYFLTPVSHISKIEVVGNKTVGSFEIVKLSELEEGDRFWPNDLKVNEELVAKHKVIKEVVINRKFVNKVQIKVVEYEKVAHLLEGGKAYPILSSGSVIRFEEKEVPETMPLLVNLEEGEALEALAKELSETSKDALEMISEIRFSPTDINPLRIVVYMTDGVEVNGTITGFAEKISAYPMISAKIPEGVQGFIDMEVGYVLKPFQSVSEEVKEEKIKE